MLSCFAGSYAAARRALNSFSLCVAAVRSTVCAPLGAWPRMRSRGFRSKPLPFDVHGCFSFVIHSTIGMNSTECNVFRIIVNRLLQTAWLARILFCESRFRHLLTNRFSGCLLLLFCLRFKAFLYFGSTCFAVAEDLLRLQKACRGLSG